MANNDKVKIVLEPGAKAPKREYPTDAGADIFANEDITIPHGEWRNIHTGLHIELPKGYFGLLFSKSGLNTQKGITCRGVIDVGYTGEIIAALQNIGPDIEIKKGDKVAQLIILPCIFPEFEIVDTINGGERGDNGFGSTGNK